MCKVKPYQSVMDIGIVNYNGGDLLYECVLSIISLKAIKPNIFVYDNNSTDCSLKKLREKKVACTIIESKENVGYAAACNQLIRMFKTPIAAISNMDLTFNENWAEQTIECFNRHPNIGLMNSLVLHQDDPPTVNSAGTKMFWDIFPLPVADGMPYSQFSGTEKEDFGAYGAVMAFSMEAIREVGEFEEDYFLFFEETDLNWRFNLSGYEIWFNPDAIVYHFRSSSTGRFSSLKLYYSERNRIFSLIKLFPLWYLPPAMLSTFIRFFILWNRTRKMERRAKMEGNTKIVSTLLKAWFDALKDLPKYRKKNKELKQKFMISWLDPFRILFKYKISFKELRFRDR